jgi:predicted pyridoxine 5'-phosphate oxidase superfamily flavin-nucleotide-binding protein
MVPEKVKKLLKEGKIIYLATSSKDGSPNLVAVESVGLFEDGILIADCHFNKTRKNLKENKKAAVLAAGSGEFFQIKGKIKYETSGKAFDIVVKSLEGTDLKAEGAVLLSCDEIYDLVNYTKLV